MKRHRLARCLVPAFVVGCAISQVHGQEQPPAPKPQEDINRTFENPDLDVERFVKQFEGESREVAAQRHVITEAIAIKPGMRVADIGAGTGLFTREFARAVGAEGKVYAVDISQSFLDYIAKRAQEDGQAGQIQTILGGQDQTNLPNRELDLVFICDTYHHFENPTAMLRSIRRSLKPGGRLVVIDFDRDEDASEFIKKHVRATKEQFQAEIEQAGFATRPAPELAGLTENFVLVFEKVRQSERISEPVQQKKGGDATKNTPPVKPAQAQGQDSPS